MSVITQGDWHTLPESLKPNLGMNPNGISHSVSCDSINARVR